MSYILVFITNPSKKVANKLALHLLKKKLIACANIFPINSIYWWEGKIEKSREWMLIIKSSEKKFTLLKKEVKKLHPYDVPVIEKIKASANAECEDWIKGVIK